MKIQITKRQEYVNDVAGEVEYQIVVDKGHCYQRLDLCFAELKELKEKLNSLEL